MDIECAGRKGCFPEPSKDPVIQASMRTHTHRPLAASSRCDGISHARKRVVMACGASLGRLALPCLRKAAPGPLQSGAAPLLLEQACGHAAQHPVCLPACLLQIASNVSLLGKTGPVVKNVLTLGTCAPIVGAQVMSFAK